MAWSKIVSQKYNQGYKGHAEACEWQFSVPLPEQIGANWIANKLIDGHVKELQKQNARLLEMEVWEDTSPTWHTDYYVRVTSTASPLFWNVIIIGVITVLAIAGLSYLLIKTEDIIEYIGEEAGGVGISLTLVAVIGTIALVGIGLLKRS